MPGLITRPVKTNTSTSFTDGMIVYASDLNGDANTIVSAINGNLNDANIVSGAAIDPAKIDDYSANAAESITVVSPGTTDSPSLATDVTGEIARLRHNDIPSGHGISAEYHNGTANAAVGPWDGVRVGHSLVQNGSLQLQSGGGATAPDGWTLSGVPTTCTLTATGKDDGDANVCRIITGGGAVGITQAIDGLKPSTVYIIGCRARAVNNAATITITGGAAAGAFQNTARTIAVHAATFTTYSIAVKTNTTPSNLTIALTTGATALDELFVHDVFVYELSKDPKSVGTSTSYRLAYTATDTVVGGSTNAWVSAPSGTSITIRPFKNNQRIVYQAALVLVKSSLTGDGGIRLLRDATVVNGPYPVGIELSTFTFYDVVDNPAPGTAITYSYQVFDATGVTDYEFNENAIGGFAPESQIYVRLEDI